MYKIFEIKTSLLWWLKKLLKVVADDSYFGNSGRWKSWVHAYQRLCTCDTPFTPFHAGVLCVSAWACVSARAETYMRFKFYSVMADMQVLAVNGVKRTRTRGTPTMV